VFAQCSRLVASIYVDRARGLEKENEELRAKQTVELITRLGPTAIKVHHQWLSFTSLRHWCSSCRACSRTPQIPWPPSSDTLPPFIPCMCYFQVGQAQSTRPDLLSLAYLEQLQTLQDRVASFSNNPSLSLYFFHALCPLFCCQVGQALSIRPDLLSLASLEQLQTLQDRVASFSNEEARSIIQEGLGRVRMRSSWTCRPRPWLPLPWARWVPAIRCLAGALHLSVIVSLFMSLCHCLPFS